jgi:IS30 family transposase
MSLNALSKLGTSKKEIALELEVHVSTVYRELNRNSDQRDQLHKTLWSDKKCQKRHKDKAKKISLTPEIKAFIDSQLLQDLSSEQISGLALANGLPCIAHERINQYIGVIRAAKGNSISI